MSPEDVMKIKSSIRDEYLELMADEDDDEFKLDLQDSLNRLSKIRTFRGLIGFMKVEGDQEQALGWILFGLCRSADDEDLKLLTQTVWRS